MTKPRYPSGCSAGSQVRGQACAWNQSNAWYVNLNNGNSNVNHQNNKGLVLAVRGPVASPGEYQGAATFEQLWKAYERAGKQKCSTNQLQFESRLIDNLLELETRINAGTWQPSPSVCFVAAKPKAREIHAPDFGDRVQHHWLVPQLEKVFEPGFVHDSFANRRGKGAHAAVERLEGYVRQVHSGQGGGWFLQLDIKTFFNSIHRPTLWRQLKRRMVKSGISSEAQRAAHALLRRPPLAAGVRYCGSPRERALVPSHKRLENAGSGCGLPIGNLSSQFFANVYLDALDQFVKHQLKAKRYVRYVDDFVLVHESREQLQAWLVAIERFLADELRLKLKADIRLKPLTAGIDFLGYVVRPTHTLVRQRVVRHAEEKLHAWGRQHITSDGSLSLAKPAELRAVNSIWASYQGHFRHAAAGRLAVRFHQRFPWLHAITVPRRRFSLDLEGQNVSINVLKAFVR